MYLRVRVSEFVGCISSLFVEYSRVKTCVVRAMLAEGLAAPAWTWVGLEWPSSAVWQSPAAETHASAVQRAMEGACAQCSTNLLEVFVLDTRLVRVHCLELKVFWWETDTVPEPYAR